jgi:hypothetical protein
MAHPFEKIFLKALKGGLSDENLVLKEAEKLIEKGYSPKEIMGVLTHLKTSLLLDAEEYVVQEAIESLEAQM